MDMESVAGTTVSVSEPEAVGLWLFLSEERWKDNKMSGWATVGALVFILLWQFAKWLVSRLRRGRNQSSRSLSPSMETEALAADPAEGLDSSTGFSDLISDADLQSLIDSLDENDSENDKWENVIERSSNTLVYKAKCCKQKDGPPKYLSLTLFETCTPKVLRDFYMDNDYRKQWDNTVVKHEQIRIDEATGVEIGRTIKKFPLLTPREYVLAWKVWEGQDDVFYCFIKDCDHPSVSRSRKYVRVESFRSGWRIRQVPGTNSCEIKMVHQEDAGFNVEMAKMAFAKGIWNYVCKMEKALRNYSSINQDQLWSEVSAVNYIQRVPFEVEEISDGRTSQTPPLASTSSFNLNESSEERNSKEILKMPSKKLIANGLLLLGGLLYLSKSHHGIGAKVAIAFVWRKLSKRAEPVGKK